MYIFVNFKVLQIIMQKVLTIKLFPWRLQKFYNNRDIIDGIIQIIQCSNNNTVYSYLYLNLSYDFILNKAPLKQRYSTIGLEILFS